MQQEMHSREGEDSCRDIIEHDSGADTRRDHDVDRVGQTSAGSERHLGECAEVGVIVDLDPDAVLPPVHRAWRGRPIVMVIAVVMMSSRRLRSIITSVPTVTRIGIPTAVGGRIVK